MNKISVIQDIIMLTVLKGYRYKEFLNKITPKRLREIYKVADELMMEIPEVTSLDRGVSAIIRAEKRKPVAYLKDQIEVFIGLLKKLYKDEIIDIFEVGFK